MFGVPLHEQLVESNPSKKIPLLSIAHPVEGIYLFQVPKTHLGMGLI